MKILVIGDIHNDIENMIGYFEKLAGMKFDIVVAAGDFTDVGMKGFSQKDIAKLILEEMKALGKPIVAVPGNLDNDIIPVLNVEDVSIHGKGKTIGGVGFYGVGGAKTPFGTSLELSEGEVELMLTNGFNDVKNAKIKIQVTHAPPARTRLDLIYTGAHIGSEAIRKFIEEHKPDVAICAHVQEAKGVDELGSVKLLNPGRFPEGHYGVISIENGKIDVKVQSLI
jgi:Icc-related predicted phosphoesterase